MPAALTPRVRPRPLKMEVLINQRQAWVRPGTHTVVFDHDADFPRFRVDPTGQLKRLLRIWLVINGDANRDPQQRTYLGACRLCAGHLEWSDLLRLLRRIRLVAEGRQLRRELRQGVVTTLRRRMSL